MCVAFQFSLKLSNWCDRLYHRLLYSEITLPITLRTLSKMPVDVDLRRTRTVGHPLDIPLSARPYSGISVCPINCATLAFSQSLFASIHAAPHCPPATGF